MMEKAEHKYIICIIMDSQKKGNVDVLLEPLLEKSQFEEPPMDGNIIVESNVPGGFPNGMMQIFKQMMPMDSMNPMGMNVGQRKGMEPHRILYTEEAIDFKTRNWHHGDKIMVSFEKIEE